MGNQQPTTVRRVEKESRIIPSGLELSEEQQKKLVKLFCGSELIDPAEVEAVVSGKPGDVVVVGSNTFFPQNGKSPFLEAARAGKLASLQFMLERYPDAIDINGRGRISQLVATRRSDKHPWATVIQTHVTALIASCFGATGGEEVTLEVVTYLISKGAHVNITSCYGTTPLMAAAEVGHVKVLRYLVRHGADVHAVNAIGHTALHHAARGGSGEAVKFLIKKGTFVNHEDHYGMCAIHIAALEGKWETVSALINGGATTLSSQGNPSDPKYVPSPILLAAAGEHLELVENLQKHCSRTLCSDAYLLYAFSRYKHSGRLGEFVRNALIAFDLRGKCSDPVEYLPPCAAYGYRTEVQTIGECWSSLHKEREYQDLIIRERCLGVQHEHVRSEILLAVKKGMHSCYAEAIALFSRVMLSVTNEVDHIPTECIAHMHMDNYVNFWDIPLSKTLLNYSRCSSRDKSQVDLVFCLQFIIRGLEYVKSSILKLSCSHRSSSDDISMLTLHGLRFLCLWLQQERANGRNPLQGKSEHDNVGETFTSAYLRAPSNSTLLCQALSPKLLYEDTPWNYSSMKHLVEDLICALLHWGADAAVNDPCIVSGQRPLHMAAEHHSHRVVSSLIEAGAHLDAVNRDGQTALDVTIKRGDPEVISTIPTSPLPLYCQVSRFIALSGNFRYKPLQLPTRVKAFISLHDKF